MAPLCFAAAGASGYDPLELPHVAEVAVPFDLEAWDEARQREIPLRVYLPFEKGKPAPLVLFSHGLGGSREGSAFLGRHWSSRGYAVVFLQHPGSDEAVWKDAPLAERTQAMQRAASLRNFMLRVRDVPAALDALEAWDAEESHILSGRLDLEKTGMSGHSFGAVTTQAVSGQRSRGGVSLADPRIKAALVLSPSVPQAGDAAAAFGQVALPWMLMTGTRDIALIGGQAIGAADMESRLGVYPALPEGGKYELVLHESDHFVFTDRPELGGEEARHPNHHRAILALSTAFWDAWLKDDPAARAWLDGEGPRGVLEPEDRWQKK